MEGSTVYWTSSLNSFGVLSDDWSLGYVTWPINYISNLSRIVSSGCVRETVLNCTNNTNVQKDEFLHMSKVDWPHNPLYLEDIGNDKECQSACLNNCSCVAYAYDQKYDRKVDGNKLIRCLVWDGSLLNLKQLSADDLYGNDFYLKLASPSIKNSKKNKKKRGRFRYYWSE